MPAFTKLGFGLATLAGCTVLVAIRRRRSLHYFRDKNIVVTGGSRGLGFRLAQHLLAGGAKVTICGRSAQSLARAAAQLATAGGSLTTVVCDVRSQAACNDLIEGAVARNGPLDILVNNAGVIEVGPFEAQTIADFREALDTHFWGPLYTILAALPGMRARRCGQIVNVSSVGGVVGVPHLAPYSASKFAQIGLTQAVAAEAKADGVTITSVVPGLMLTGSPDHAVFKGRHRAEYAWFTLSDANPLLSTTADASVRRILKAMRTHKYQASIGWTATAARIATGLLPNITTGVLAFAARLLPKSGNTGTERHAGAASHSLWTDNALAALNTSAMSELNQDGVTPPNKRDAD